MANQPSIFTRIIKGEIPTNFILQNNNFVAFLDNRPMTLGHTLVVPVNEIDYFFDMEDEEYTKLIIACKPISKAIQKATNCKRVCVSIQGFEVPHVHIHLVPCNNEAEIDFKNRKTFSEEEQKDMVSKIQSFL